MKNETSDQKLEVIELILRAKRLQKLLVLERTEKGESRSISIFAKITHIDIKTGNVSVNEYKRHKLNDITKADFPGSRKNTALGKTLNTFQTIHYAKQIRKPLLIERTTHGKTKPNSALARIIGINDDAKDVCVIEHKRHNFDKITNARFLGIQNSY